MTKSYRKKDWLEFAHASEWSVSRLAKRAGISVRGLERYFLRNMGKPPKTWLAEQRHKQAIELLRDNSSVKEAAAKLGYAQACTFSREFKKYWGQCPSAFQKARSSKMSH